MGGCYCNCLPVQAGELPAELLKMKSRRAGPPDGGYGLVVVTSAFFTMGLTAAVLKNYGHFFLEIQSHFGVLTSTTSWVTSTTIAMFHIGGKVCHLPLISCPCESQGPFLVLRFLSVRSSSSQCADLALFSESGDGGRRPAVHFGVVVGISGPQSALALPHHGHPGR